MNRNRKQTEKQGWILSLLGSILLLTLAARTETGQVFLEYAREMAEDMPFASKIVEFQRGIQEEVEKRLSDFGNRGAVDERADFDGDDTEEEQTPESEESGQREEAEQAAAPILQESAANEQILSPESETLFPLNHSAYFPQSITIQNSRLTLCGIPEDGVYRYIMLQLNNPDGTEAYQETEHRGTSGEVSFSLKNVKPQSKGTFHSFQMRMYSNSERYGDYTGFLELSVEKTDSDWHIVNSPVYERNYLFAQDERTDANALTYYLKASERIQSDNDSIQETADQIASGAANAYEKALLIHDWVSDNIYYDRDAFYKRADGGDSSALGTLRSRRGVCEGYANLTCALLRAAGIPAKTVSGYALGISGGNEFPESVLQGTGDANHAWVEACIGGRWITLDTTWDSGNSYEYGQITDSSGCRSHRYFDISRELLAQDHAVMDSNNYQEIFLYYNNPQMETAHGWKAFSESNLAPYEKDGHMMAPVGAIMEEMGGVCEWDRTGYYDRLGCKVNGHYLQLWPTQKELWLDDFVGKEAKKLTFDVAPEVINGYTMVQVDLTFSAVECEVVWDESQNRLMIGYIT